MITGTLTYSCDECGIPTVEVEIDGGHPPLEGPNWPAGWVQFEELELCPDCAAAKGLSR